MHFWGEGGGGGGGGCSKEKKERKMIQKQTKRKLLVMNKVSGQDKEEEEAAQTKETKGKRPFHVTDMHTHTEKEIYTCAPFSYKYASIVIGFALLA